MKPGFVFMQIGTANLDRVYDEAVAPAIAYAAVVEAAA